MWDVNVPSDGGTGGVPSVWDVNVPSDGGTGGVPSGDRDVTASLPPPIIGNFVFFWYKIFKFFKNFYKVYRKIFVLP